MTVWGDLAKEAVKLFWLAKPSYWKAMESASLADITMHPTAASGRFLEGSMK
jgi:hypothetical protein